VISGINRGLNIGTDVMYSGTAAAVFEAGNLGLPAIALSTEPKYYDHATDHLDMVLDFFLKNKLMDVHSLYNVNIPFNVKGIRICRQGGHYYSDDFLPQGNDMYLPKGVCVYEADDDYTIDTHAALNGYISVSPLTIIRTDMDIYNKLTYLNP
jgi:5'-nucleotidase